MGIKQHIQTRHFERLAALIPLSPNTITLLSVISALIAAYMIFMNEVAYGLAFVLIAFVFDSIDGIVARAKRQETRFGAYLDGVSDRIVEFFILASMIGLGWPNTALAISSLLIIMGFGTFLTSFAKAYADHKGVIRKNQVQKLSCVFERAERSIFIFASLLIYLANPTYSMYLLSFTALLSVIGFLQRFIAVAHLSGFLWHRPRRK
ncbi:MAG: CDP-alcohol phosphatidyltransferase family protein [Candidatus Micrarchaeota archaeon]|nr:CDP-alcohol phosphatidyltransferase family protein [Candidatus Micrarchaeota archaeon]